MADLVLPDLDIAGWVPGLSLSADGVAVDAVAARIGSAGNRDKRQGPCVPSGALYALAACDRQEENVVDKTADLTEAVFKAVEAGQ